MRKFYIILFFFIGCTAVGNDDRPEPPAPVDLNAEIAALKTRVTKPETDSTYPAKQIASLIKPVTPLTGKLSFLTSRFIADSVKQWGEQSKDLSQDKNLTALQSQVNTAGIKNGSLGNLIIKYATKLNLTQFTITAGVVSIPALITLQTRATNLEALQPPGQ